MKVWLQNPFDNLPEEGHRKQRYRLMAEAFVRAGHEAVLFTSDFSHAKKLRRVFVRDFGARPETVLVPTPTYRSNISLSRILSHLVYAWRWYRLAKARVAAEGRAPDMLIVSMPTVSGAYAALRFGRRFGVRTIVDVQDAWPETFYRLSPRPLAPLVRLALSPVRFAARRIYARADRVTGVCDRYRALCARGDYRRFYLGIEGVGSVPCRRFAAPRRYVYAGASGISYDLRHWIEKVEADESLSLDVASTADVVSSCPRIRSHGYLDAEALKALFARCDTGIIPMADDSYVGVPNKFFDYAAAGLRIETTLGGECRALCERWNAALAAGDVSSLVRELDAVAIYDSYVKFTGG